MTESALEDYLTLRPLDEWAPDEAFLSATKGAVGVLQELGADAADPLRVKPNTRSKPDGALVGTFSRTEARPKRRSACTLSGPVFGSPESTCTTSRSNTRHRAVKPSASRGRSRHDPQKRGFQ